MRHHNRMRRNQGKRMVKVASREQMRLKRRGLGPEGLTCPICSPKQWGAANHREARERAAVEAIEEYLET